MADPLPFVSFGARRLSLTWPQLQGTDVRELQVIYNEMLKIMNPPQGPLGTPITADGVFGPETRQAVRNVQSYFALSVDGIVGELTFLAFGQPVGRYVTYGGPRFGSRTLAVGVSGGDVVVLQNRLNCFRYAAALGGAADGDFGPKTRAAVIEFQADALANGAPVPDESGRVGAATGQALWLYTYTGARDLRDPDKGFDVAWLQLVLATLIDPATSKPFYGGAVDGHFGASTHAAVTALQAVSGIATDGVAGQATYHHVGLRNDHAAPLPAPVPPI